MPGDHIERLAEYVGASRSHALCCQAYRLHALLPTLDTAERWAPLRKVLADNPGGGMFRDPNLVDPDAVWDAVWPVIREVPDA